MQNIQTWPHVSSAKALEPAGSGVGHRVRVQLPTPSTRRQAARAEFPLVVEARSEPQEKAGLALVSVDSVFQGPGRGRQPGGRGGSSSCESEGDLRPTDDRDT